MAAGDPLDQAAALAQNLRLRALRQPGLTQDQRSKARAAASQLEAARAIKFLRVAPGLPPLGTGLPKGNLSPPSPSRPRPTRA